MKVIHLCLLGPLMASIACGADAWDPTDNTSPGTTLTLSPTQQVHGPHTMDYTESDTEDWFSCDLIAGQRYRFESTGTADMDAMLYSDIGSTAVAADNQDNGDAANFELIFVPETNDTYYLKVEYYANSVGMDHASYDLFYQYGPVLDAWDPGDNTFSNAPSLVPVESENVHGSHYLSADDAVDWFHFYLETNLTYTFEALGGWDTIGTLYFEGTTYVIENDDSGIEGDEEFNFSITYSPTNSGDYHLKVVNYDVGDNLEFSLRYWISDSPDTDEDGMSDADEAIAGTDPDDDTSYFAVTNWTTGSFTIEWPAFPNRVYRVYRADSLTNTFNPVGPVIHYPQNSYTESSLGESGFYKVEVQLK
jgi:hypothetical protein